jgi:ABC-type uncharacterized transport system involved in gliding motility auxiliary subunit
MKSLKPRFKFLKYLVWLAPMLVIMGISAGLTAGSWGVVPIGLIVAGLIIFVTWMIFVGRGEESLQPKFWQRRSTQASTNALVSTIAVFVILALLNFLAVRHVNRLDLTEARLFTLAPETQQILRQLNQNVKLYIFDTQPNTQDRELLENYQRQNPRFSYAYIDPEGNPGLAQQFGIKNSQDSKDVYLERDSNKQRQFVQAIGSNVRLSESQLTNKILQITTDGGTKAYFLQGHGEKSLEGGEGSISVAGKVLEVKNYVPKPLNLAQGGKVPADASVVVIAGPTKTIPEAEVKVLQDYLDQGGNLLVAVDPTVKAGLDGLLSPWGVKFDDRVAVNAPKQQVLNAGPAVAIINQYGTHPITKDFGNTYSFYPLARPIDLSNVSGVQTTPLLLTNPSSWAESNLKEQPLQLSDGDRPGPLAIGVALSRTVTPPAPSPSPSASPSPGASVSPSPSASASPSPISSASASPSPSASASPSPSGTPSPSPSVSASPSPSASPGTPKESRLVVFGNSSFISDGYFDKYLNGDVFLNSVSWASQQGQQPLSIRPKDIKNRRIILNQEQQLTLFLVAIVLIPFIGFLAAGVAWWRRR